MFRSLDEHVLIINVLNDVYISVLSIDLDNDRFDGRVALDEHPCRYQHVPNIGQR